MIAIALALAAPPAADYGPSPTTEQIKTVATEAVLARLIDPGSAQISWPYAAVPATMKGLLNGRVTGWAICGRVNSKNRMGGYSGETWALVIINAGQVQRVEIGDPLGEVTPAGLTCDAWQRDGTLKPMTASPTVVTTLQARGMDSATKAKEAGGYGFSYLPTAYGIYVMAVAPGSRAASAGLKAGTDIVDINGTPTQGMTGDQVKALLASRPTGGFALRGSDGIMIQLPRL